MVRTQKFDLDTDTTLGGNNASDYIAPSQKAIKDYVDNHSGGDTEIFVATYNVTSYNDILNAYNAGKTLVFKVPKNNNIYYFTEYEFINNEFFFTPTINGKKNSFIIFSAGWDNWEYGNDIIDVQINGNSIVDNSSIANILTNSAYSSSNKIATMNDLPAEQVNSDWNANSGKAQILNKPSLSTVATSGSYNDLSNKPNIPTESTVSGWGFTKNVGTVTSVNNVAPVGGNVTLTIPFPATYGTTTYTEIQEAYGLKKYVYLIIMEGGTYITLPLVSLTNVATFSANIGNEVIRTCTCDSYLDTWSSSTTNVGTVTSVNNTSPDANGNVTIATSSASYDSTNERITWS